MKGKLGMLNKEIRNKRIERGMKLIPNAKRNEWEECIDLCAQGAFGGLDIDSALDIMEALDNGVSIDEIKQMLENLGLSGYADSIIRSIVLRFSNEGPKFWRETAVFEITPEQEKILIEIENKNKIIAETEQENELKLETLICRGIMSMRKTKKNAKTTKYIEWINAVEKRMNDIYKGKDVECTLDIMEALDNGASMDEVKELFDSFNCSGTVAMIIRSMVGHFHAQGTQFCKATDIKKYLKK